MGKNEKPEKEQSILDALKDLNNLGIKIPFMKGKLTLKKLLLIEFITNAARGDVSYGKVLDKLINMVKVFIVATRKFLEDQCLTRASSITYTIIVSLVPTTAVIFSYFYRMEGKKDDLFVRISVFMAEHNVRLDMEPIFAILSALVENAGKIGGISAIIMIFTATAMLRTLEGSLNHIWKVNQQRRFHIKMVYYWSALTLGPMLLIAGTGIATQMSNAFSSPDYATVQPANNKVWIPGSKSTLLAFESNMSNYTQVSNDTIDFENQQIYSYDATTKTFSLTSVASDMIEVDPTKINYSDIQFIGNTGWVTGNQGVILYTSNGGKTWSLKKWGNFSFHDIHMLNREAGFLISDNSVLFTTEDGGKSWHTKEQALSVGLNSITFRGNNGVITGGNGTILYTNDSGKTWNILKINEAKVKNNFVTINDAFFINDDIIWLACNNGLLLQSQNGGKSWRPVIIKKRHFNAIHFFDKNNGIAAGVKGRTVFTNDGGVSWTENRLRTTSINAFIELKNKELWAVGDKGLALYTKDMGKTWDGTEGRTSIISFLINYSAPLLFIWILFFFCYIMLPNTKVPAKEAAIGAAFTSMVWVIFILLFTVYIQNFAKGTFAVYGALASIPLFLLMIYASIIIVLYGAEVSYTLMHPEIYSNLYRSMNDRREIHIYYGITIVYNIYKKFEAGNGGSDYKELSKLCMYNSEEVDFFLNKFVHEKLIIQDAVMGYIPANSSQNIQLSSLINSINAISLLVPKGVKKSPIKDYMDNLFKQMEQNRKNIVGEATLKDIMNQEVS